MMSLFAKPILALLQLKPIPDIHNSWVFYWLIILTLLLVALKILFPKQLINSILALINKKSFGALRQDGFIPSNIVNILLTALYVASLGLLISVVTSHFYIKENLNWSFSIAIYTSLLSGAYIILKFGFIIISQWIYQAKDIAINYMNVLVISYNIFGIIIFFGLWLMLYTDFNFGLIILLSVLSILFVIRLLKLSSLTEMKNNFSLFSFIVYICTVEILPLIIAQKLYFYWVLTI